MADANVSATGLVNAFGDWTLITLETPETFEISFAMPSEEEKTPTVILLESFWAADMTLRVALGTTGDPEIWSAMTNA